MSQTAREPPYRRHDPRTAGFGRAVNHRPVAHLTAAPTAAPVEPPAFSTRPLWAEMSPGLARKIGVALVRGDTPTLRLRITSGQVDLSSDDVLELCVILDELGSDIQPFVDLLSEETEDDAAMSAAR